VLDIVLSKIKAEKVTESLRKGTFLKKSLPIVILGAVSIRVINNELDFIFFLLYFSFLFSIYFSLIFIFIILDLGKEV